MQSVKHLMAGNVGQLQVQQQHIGRLLQSCGDAAVAIFGAAQPHLRPHRQHFTYQDQIHRVVLDTQDVEARGGRGRGCCWRDGGLWFVGRRAWARRVVGALRDLEQAVDKCQQLAPRLFDQAQALQLLA